MRRWPWACHHERLYGLLAVVRPPGGYLFHFLRWRTKTLKSIVVTTKKELADAIAGMPLDEPVKITLRRTHSQTVYRFDYTQLCDVLDAQGNGNGSTYYGGAPSYGGKESESRHYARMRGAGPEERAVLYRDHLTRIASKVRRLPDRAFR